MNATSASLLGLLDASGGELTGGELVRTAQTRIGEFWSLTRSQVYRELAALETEGMVKAGARGPRESRPYSITTAGKSEYRRWLSEELPGPSIRMPLLLAVCFGAALPPGSLERLLDRAEADHRAKLEAYEALDAELEAVGVDPFSRATLSLGLHYQRATLSWLESLPETVRRA